MRSRGRYMLSGLRTRRRHGRRLRHEGCRSGKKAVLILEGLCVSCTEGPASPIAVDESEYGSAEDMFGMLQPNMMLAQWTWSL